MGSTAAVARILHFGVFEVDLKACELRKHGLRLKLPEQPFQVLAVLLENPGEIVTRDELRNRLWQGDTFVDFDHGVNNAVMRLREVLGDLLTTRALWRLSPGVVIALLRRLLRRLRGSPFQLPLLVTKSWKMSMVPHQRVGRGWSKRQLWKLLLNQQASGKSPQSRV